MPIEEAKRTSLEGAPRGGVLSTASVLVALLALSHLTMFAQNFYRPRVGAVLFGARFHSVAGNAVVGTLLGALLAAYAYGLWKLDARVVPIAIGFALYMPVNLTTYWFLHPEIAEDRVFFWLAYHLVLSLGFVGTGLFVTFHRDRFR